jgi:uncharacterized protein (DUF885 family)
LISAIFLAGSLAGAPLQAFAGPVPASVSGEDSIQQNARLRDWFDQQYERELLESPIQLSFQGRSERNDEIDCMSRACQEARLDRARAAIEALRSEFDYERLSPADRDSYDLWLRLFRRAQEAAAWRDNGLVFDQMSGMHTFFPTFLIQFHRVDDEQDAEAYVRRIHAVAHALRQLLDEARLKAAKGVHAPRFAYEAVIAESQKILSGAPFEAGPDNPVLADFRAEVQALLDAGRTTPETAAILVDEAEAALAGDFRQAYEELIAFAHQDLANSPDPSGPQGVSTQPGGEAYYLHRLHLMTTTHLSADEIHQLGLEEVERIQAEMETIRQAVGFEGTLGEFFATIRSSTDDPVHYFPNTDEGRRAYIDEATSAIERIKEVLPQYFGLLPKADLVVRRVEAFREQPGAAQHYYPGTPDGSRPGIYYAHLSDMTAMPRGELEVIAYHEGLPGHHMQISIAQELTGIPRFRTQADFTAYSEGWALYSEKLAREMPGTFQDPYSDFGRLGSEIWRAIRLVVDTGLHAKGWSEDEAVNYFLANSAITEAQARSEVQRYIVTPGQATAYKIGMIGIERMRARAEAELGERFDIRTFHDILLGGGALPLDMLEAKVELWIRQANGQH